MGKRRIHESLIIKRYNKETRTIHELLIILRNNVKVTKSWFGFKQRIHNGLCWDVVRLYDISIIDQHEKIILIDYINKSIDSNSYYWPMGEWKPRSKWLNEHIELTK